MKRPPGRLLAASSLLLAALLCAPAHASRVLHEETASFSKPGLIPVADGQKAVPCFGAFNAWAAGNCTDVRACCSELTGLGAPCLAEVAAAAAADANLGNVTASLQSCGLTDIQQVTAAEQRRDRDDGDEGSRGDGDSGGEDGSRSDEDGWGRGRGGDEDESSDDGSQDGGDGNESGSARDGDEEESSDNGSRDGGGGKESDGGRNSGDEEESSDDGGKDNPGGDADAEPDSDPPTTDESSGEEEPDEPPTDTSSGDDAEEEASGSGEDVDGEESSSGDDADEEDSGSGDDAGEEDADGEESGSGDTPPDSSSGEDDAPTDSTPPDSGSGSGGAPTSSPPPPPPPSGGSGSGADTPTSGSGGAGGAGGSGGSGGSGPSTGADWGGGNGGATDTGTTDTSTTDTSTDEGAGGGGDWGSGGGGEGFGGGSGGGGSGPPKGIPPVITPPATPSVIPQVTPPVIITPPVVGSPPPSPPPPPPPSPLIPGKGPGNPWESSGDVLTDPPVVPSPSPSPKPSPSPSPKPSPSPSPVPSPSPKPSPSPSPVPSPSPTPPVTQAGPTTPFVSSASGATLIGYADGVPGRIQYGQNNGYCGETTIQQLMLEHGAWIPQEVARSQSGGEMLLAVNYDKGMNGLKVAFDKFTGSGFQAFVTFAKQKLREGKGIVAVTYLQGYGDADYDHIVPFVGFRSSAPDSSYSDADVIYVNSDVEEKTLQRVAGSYSCSSGNKKDGVFTSGCVPTNTRFGYAIRGPVYAGIGPTVELTGLSSPREPGLGRSTGMTGRAILRGLVPGQSYTLHQVTSLAEVPSSPTGAVGGRVIHSFVATAAEQSFDVSWQSGTMSYFIARGAVAAPGGGGSTSSNPPAAPSTPIIPPTTPTNPPPSPRPSPSPSPMPPPVTPPPTTPTGGSNGITASSAGISGCPDILATLDAHNAARARRGAPPLIWDDNLAKFAMTVSSTCTMQHSGGPYGENLAWGSTLRTCKPAVDMWMEEEAAWRPGGGFSSATGNYGGLYAANV